LDPASGLDSIQTRSFSERTLSRHFQQSSASPTGRGRYLSAFKFFVAVVRAVVHLKSKVAGTGFGL
jgi:hypothetical protein